MPGVIFRPIHFTPWSSKHQGKVCQGVQVHVIDREAYKPLHTGLEIIAVCQELAQRDFSFLPPSGDDRRCHFDLLAGSDRLRLNLLNRTPVQEMARHWEAGLAGFLKTRANYLIYDE